MLELRRLILRGSLEICMIDCMMGLLLCIGSDELSPENQTIDSEQVRQASLGKENL